MTFSFFAVAFVGIDLVLVLIFVVDVVVFLLTVMTFPVSLGASPVVTIVFFQVIADLFPQKKFVLSLPLAFIVVVFSANLGMLEP